MFFSPIKINILESSFQKSNQMESSDPGQVFKNIQNTPLTYVFVHR